MEFLTISDIVSVSVHHSLHKWALWGWWILPPWCTPSLWWGRPTPLALCLVLRWAALDCTTTNMSAVCDVCSYFVSELKLLTGDDSFNQTKLLITFLMLTQSLFFLNEFPSTCLESPFFHNISFSRLTSAFLQSPYWLSDISSAPPPSCISSWNSPPQPLVLPARVLSEPLDRTRLHTSLSRISCRASL